MKRYFRPKLVLRLAAILMIAAVVAVPLAKNITHSHAASPKTVLSENFETGAPSELPHPAKQSSVPAGDISAALAKDIATKSLNVALTQFTGKPAQLVLMGNTMRVKRLQGNNGARLMADAEAHLRSVLARQGYTQAQIDTAVTSIKSVATSIAQQAENDSISIPTDPHGTIGFGANVTLSLPSDSSTGSAASLTQNAVLYNNTSTTTDTVVKAVDAQTIETYHIIRGKNAPENFVYKLNNPPTGMLLRQVDAQTVEVYLPQQTYGRGSQAQNVPEAVVATIEAPWARDANGVAVPVSLTIGANNTMILHVFHKNGNFLYPIVADPFAHWGWWGFMWWGNDWTINHYLWALGGVGSIASGISAIAGGAVGWGVAAAVFGTIGGLAGWCEGINGATYYFLWNGAFVYCNGW
jgi:hypothetical protein